MANAAYDYTLFETSAAPKEQPARKPELKMVRSRPQAFAQVFSPRVISTFFVIVTLVSLIVYNQVCLNEVTDQINELGVEMNKLESDSVRYASLLESTVSLRAVAQQAEEELGMSKLDQYQTVYVYLYEEDQVILAKQPEPQAENSGVVAAIGSLIDNAKEYFGGR